MIDLKLQYRSTGEKMLGYSDADWANDSDDRHSTTGIMFTMSGGAISWLSQKQATRGVPIIGSTDISATDRVIFTTSVIGTTITQPADINTDYSACEIYFI